MAKRDREVTKKLKEEYQQMNQLILNEINNESEKKAP